MKSGEHVKIEIYSWGLVYASVCAPADLPLAEVERQVNVELPTGIGSCWRKDESDFRNGQTNPCSCENGVVGQFDAPP